jgi:hypothetical protein
MLKFNIFEVCKTEPKYEEVRKSTLHAQEHAKVCECMQKCTKVHKCAQKCVDAIECTCAKAR